ncbi:restriction endonuclease subunit S [Haloferula sp. A504]|uniref:restriction endonuclease subunit S n=1 Tax=Haloferula sp. A504 TaxID=3373601 RepID=UPI0031C78250|nr:restriction endonuclease subunit S [Verrucomicrobiaceae bacterium E54]
MKPGYKQTEVGVIPEDWETPSIGDYRPFVTSGSRGWAAYYEEYGSPFIRITNLNRGSIHLDLDDLRFVAIPPQNTEGQRTVLQDDDLLISITADIGIVGIVSHELPKPAYINQHIALVRFDRGRISPKYVTYFLGSERTQRIFRALTDSGAKAGMNLTTVQQIRFAAPPTLAEQEAIAAALSDADALIDSLEQLIAKKRLLKQGAMQDLLTGKKRLPGFEGEWEVKTLGELFTFKNGLNKSKEFFGHGTPIVNYMDVFEAPMLTPQRLIGKVSLTRSELNAYDVRSGDVFFTRTSETPDEVGMAAVITGEPVDTVFSGFVLRARPKQDVFDNAYKAFCFRTPEVRDQIVAKASYTTRALTNGRALSTVKIRVPEKSEQTAIAAILSDMDAELAALEAKLAKARQVKQGMMQELLTGKTRLI